MTIASALTEFLYSNNYYLANAKRIAVGTCSETKPGGGATAE